MWVNRTIRRVTALKICSTAVFLIVLVLVSGCIQTQEKTDSFVGGSEGLKLEFQNLPEIIVPGAPFDILVLASNAGEADVPVNSIRFTLNNAATLGITEITKGNTELLRGSQRIKDTLVPGENLVMSWPNAKFTGTVLTEEQKVPIVVDACYPYKTAAKVSKACIARGKEVCEPLGKKPVESAGAPIKITEYSQSSVQLTKDTIQLNLDFKVKNAAGQTAYSNAARCLNLADEELNKVTITSLKLGLKEYFTQDTCEEVAITLDNKGEGIGHCKLVIDTQNDFEEELTIKLDYIYKQHISTQVPILPTRT